MARDMTPVLKRCRSLGIDPIFMGIDKKSNRNARAGGNRVSMAFS